MSRPLPERSSTVHARLRRLAALGLALTLAGMGATGAVQADGHSGGRVIILGFDGADPALTRQWMEEGHLPNLKALAQEGSFHELQVTNPAQTPVSWTAFSTGLNPGKTQIFDFLKRQPASYKPAFALQEEDSRPFLWGRRWNRLVLPALAGACVGAIAWLLLNFRRGMARRSRLAFAVAAAAVTLIPAWLAVTRLLPDRVPWVRNNSKGEFFWETLGKDGVSSRIFRVPGTFPAREVMGGRLISGLGVPDMHGTVGKPFLFTDDTALTAGDNEFSVELVRVDGSAKRIESAIPGPRNRPFFSYPVEDAAAGLSEEEGAKAREAMRRKLIEAGVREDLDVPLTIERNGDSVTVTVEGQTATLGPDAWSDWMVVEFRFNPLIALKGMVRFHLLETSPHLKLYSSPIHFHPESHPIPYSFPADEAARLATNDGLFKTMGWAVDTWTISSDLAGEEHFAEDLKLTEDQYEKMFEEFLKEDTRLLVHVSEFTDRAAHVLWRLRDKEHPRYDPILAAKYEGLILECYERMDRMVGTARKGLGPDDLLIVLSDHGFTSWRRGVNYNTWLVRNGFMTLKDETGVMTLDDLFQNSGALFKNVDWSRTQAYALGLGNIYINLAGREPQGVVTPDHYDQVCAAIRSGLESLTDPETGDHPVHRVYRRDEIYTGFDPALTPDLRATNTPNYRVSWQTTLGGVPPDVFEVNNKAWSGDHCSVDPSFVPGILFTSRPLKRETVSIMDLAPTVLDWFGAQPAVPLDGKSFKDDLGTP